MTETATRGYHPARNSNALTLTNTINRILLLVTLILRFLVWPIRLISEFLFPPKEFDGITNTADKAARAFSAYFDKQYLGSSSTNSNSDNTAPTAPNSNSTQNPFQPTGYTKTLVESYRQKKLCLVYLHSPLHSQSTSFCQRILSHPRVLEVLNPNFIVWGGSIHTADGAHVAEMLHVSAYPYVAVLACGGTDGTRVDMLWKTEGDYSNAFTVDTFLRGINTVLRGFQAILAEAEMRRFRREEEVRLRQEQDREFQETLLADQQRENERLAKLKAEQEEEEARKNAIETALLQKQEQIAASQQLLTEEPPPKTPGTTRLRITLPSGKKMDRRFYSSEQIKHVRAFVRVWMHENEVPIENFELSSNYPKKTYSDEEISLEEGGLSPMAVLMVQDLDA